LGKRRDSSVIRRLDLIRHAHAQPASPDGDAGRELSSEGVAAARNLGRNLCVTGWRPDVVLTSPLARAHQTARLLVEEQADAIPIEVLDELVSEEEPAAAWSAIESAARGRRHVVVVGHQPLMGRLIEKMSGQSVSVPPCSLHAVELTAGSGSGRIVARG
jgi:phosphohistidine phosphatase